MQGAGSLLKSHLSSWDGRHSFAIASELSSFASALSPHFFSFPRRFRISDILLGFVAMTISFFVGHLAAVSTVVVMAKNMITLSEYLDAVRSP